MSEQTETNENKLSQVTTSSILEVIEEGAQVYSEITSNFIKNFTFYDKTLYGWASDLMIEIPNVKDLDTVQFRKIMLQLAHNTHIANNYYSVSCSISDAVVGGNSIKKSDVVNAIVSNYQKRGDGHFYHVILNGIRNMPKYGHAVSEHERWKIVLHIRNLQKNVKL